MGKKKQKEKKEGKKYVCTSVYAWENKVDLTVFAANISI